MRDCIADITTLAETDLAESPDAYSKAMKGAYWKDKDLAGAIAIAFAGISRLLTDACRADVTRAGELRSEAKALTYDLASFTWPGWDEPGIIVTPPEMRAGYAAARANLAMAHELDKGEGARSRAHWILGAHELAAGHHQEARTSFEQAAMLADHATEPAEAELARAFGALVLVAEDPSAEPELEETLARLMAIEGGAEFATQVRTARSVFEI